MLTKFGEGVSCEIGTRIIHTGDYLFADESGIIIIPSEIDINEFDGKVRDRAVKERSTQLLFDEKIAQGKPVDREFLDVVYKKNGMW